MSKFLILTGSSGGIGQSISETYSKDGYTVLELDKINKTQSNKNAIYLKVDLLKYSKDHDYRSKIKKHIKSFIPEDIKKFVIINNAAVQILNPLSRISNSDWDNTLSVNLIAPFFLIQDFEEELKKYKGHIVNISSIHSRLTKTNFLFYASSKAAIDSMTRSLAIELSKFGVKVNAVSPAAIKTEMLKKGFTGRLNKLNQLESCHPAKEIGNPDDLATFIKSITDQVSNFMTGSIFDFNGGIGGRLNDPE